MWKQCSLKIVSPLPLDALLIDAIEAENDDDWIMPIETEDVIIPYKLDTGSQMDILPLKDYENIRAKKRIIKNSVKLDI